MQRLEPNTSSTGDAGQKSGVLTRALTLLETVAMHADGIGVREAARQTAIDRSAVSRILAQFEELGYVEQGGSRGVHVAGPGLFALVAVLSERDSLWKAAEPFLMNLVARFNETCYVAARVGDSLVFRGKVDCEHRIRYVIEMGKPFPLVGGAAATAVLSGMPEQESDAILSGELPAYHRPASPIPTSTALSCAPTAHSVTPTVPAAGCAAGRASRRPTLTRAHGWRARSR
jgi:DNA-binding IclR family transcriptional regulator